MIKHTGDGFFAAFDKPAEAVAAAVEIQQSIADEPFKVRIGLHSGEALVRGSDYSGRGVNVAARIGALADAGEVLVSTDTLDGVETPFGLLVAALGRAEGLRRAGADRPGRRRDEALHERTSSGCAAPSTSSTRSPGSAPNSSESCSGAMASSARWVRSPAGQAVQMVKAGLQSVYGSRAGRWRPTRTTPGRRSRPEPLPRRLGAVCRQAHQQRAAPRGPDSRRLRGQARRSGSSPCSPTPRPVSAAP